MGRQPGEMPAADLDRKVGLSQGLKGGAEAGQLIDDAAWAAGQQGRGAESGRDGQRTKGPDVALLVVATM